VYIELDLFDYLPESIELMVWLDAMPSVSGAERVLPLRRDHKELDAAATVARYSEVVEFGSKRRIGTVYLPTTTFDSPDAPPEQCWIVIKPLP
jgi:hypothetical protein